MLKPFFLKYYKNSFLANILGLLGNVLFYFAVWGLITTVTGKDYDLRGRLTECAIIFLLSFLMTFLAKRRSEKKTMEKDALKELYKENRQRQNAQKNRFDQSLAKQKERHDYYTSQLSMLPESYLLTISKSQVLSVTLTLILRDIQKELGAYTNQITQQPMTLSAERQGEIMSLLGASYFLTLSDLDDQSVLKNEISQKFELRSIALNEFISTMTSYIRRYMIGEIDYDGLAERLYYAMMRSHMKKENVDGIHGVTGTAFGFYKTQAMIVEGGKDPIIGQLVTKYRKLVAQDGEKNSKNAAIFHFLIRTMEHYEKHLGNDGKLDDVFIEQLKENGLDPLPIPDAVAAIEEYSDLFIQGEINNEQLEILIWGSYMQARWYEQM